MTKNSELKQRIRERMKRTGERYTAARAQILASGVPAQKAGAYPGLMPGYGSLGGMQSDSALLARVFAHAGIVHPATGCCSARTQTSCARSSARLASSTKLRARRCRNSAWALSWVGSNVE